MGDERATLRRAITALPDTAASWLLGVAKGDQIPNIDGSRFRRSHRDRLAWHTLVAQAVTASPADESTPEQVYDDAPESAPGRYEVGGPVTQNADSVAQTGGSVDRPPSIADGTVSGCLVWLLRCAGDEWGPAGVAAAACELAGLPAPDIRAEQPHRSTDGGPTMAKPKCEFRV